jgi:NAD(P)-dependent dehydrogenase (short-subunit alcohol dehydrogenase family)
MVADDVFHREHMRPNPDYGRAVVIGANGGIGSALVRALEAQDAWSDIIRLDRASDPPLDLTDPDSIAAAARAVSADWRPLRLVINAAGVLDRRGGVAEKIWKQIDATAMQRVFAINTIGPALLMKNFLPLLAPGRSVFAMLSARVGSIGDNRLGGWYSYRASKAALNQLLRTAAIELRRVRPDAICVALHPGTVATRLSTPYVDGKADVQTPDAAAQRLLDVISSLSARQSGQFFDHRGEPVPW